jgi:hypothetical protein
MLLCQKLSILPGELKTLAKVWKTPAKLATITPWEAVCVDLIGPYTLHGKDGTEIDFMCLTMIDPAKLVLKYLYGKMVSSTKQKAGMTVHCPYKWHNLGRMWKQIKKFKHQKSYTIF